MNKPQISTIIVIIAITIIGLYAVGEVNYYSTKMVKETNIDSPVIIINSIGLCEKINNVSLSRGVFFDNKSFTPTHGDVLLFGHRTLQGSPFLRLNDVNSGDIITLDWPGIGEANYSVINKTIVPADYNIQTSNDSQHVFLITCDPIGSTANRLIIEGNLTSQGPLDNNVIEENPQAYYATLIIIGFVILSLIVIYLTPKENRIYVLIWALIITAILIYFYFCPISSDIVYSKINFLNGGFIENI